MEDPILSGKYQLCRAIGKGRTGTVYLALHKELEEYRAIKVVEKSSLQYETFRQEALLLKELRHPGIPIVYDIEEDGERGYLVEEYLQGVSLESLVGVQGPLDPSSVLRYGLQICDVVAYLHSAEAGPILHLDLQPKNLLLCHETVKLVDFGQAARLTEANQAVQRFGTVGFAAPEQYDHSMEMDERTDIYAIGGLLFFLATGMYPDQEMSPAMLGRVLWSRRAGQVLAGCLEPVKEARYCCVGQLKKELEDLMEQPLSSLTVAVYGLAPHIGTTHISLALSAYLWRRRIPNLYEECHPSEHIRRLVESQKGEMDLFGIYRAFGCMLKPCYGRQARFLEHHYPVVVKDCGVWQEGADEGQALILLVAGGKWWDRQVPADVAERLGGGSKGKLWICYNLPGRKVRLTRPAKLERSRMLKVPLFADPFYPDPPAEGWLGMLWDMLEMGWQASSGKRAGGRGAGRSAGKRLAGMLSGRGAPGRAAELGRICVRLWRRLWRWEKKRP